MRDALKLNLGVGFVLASGVAFTALNVGHLLGPEPLGSLLLGVFPPTALSLALLAYGVRLARSSVLPRDAWRVGLWTLLGVGVGAAAAVLFVAYEQFHGGRLVEVAYVVVNTATGGGGIGALLGHYDVRWRRQARELDTTNRVLDTVRKVGRVVVTADDRCELERRACRALADADPYVFAWIGGVDGDRNEVVPRTGAGVDEGYLDDITIRLDDDETARGPTGEAVRTGEPQVLQNVLDSPEYEPWRADALARGYQSSMAIPLVNDGDLYGVLNVYADRPAAFDEREQTILRELGDTVADGIAANAARRSRQAVLDGMDDAVLVYSLDREQMLTVNRAAVDRLGYDEDELLALDPAEIEASGSARDVSENLRRTAEEGSLVFETVHETADGTEIPVEVNATHVRFQGDSAVLAIARDIREREERERKLRTFREAVDHAGHAIYITDADGTIEYANAAFEEQTGYDEAEVVGSTPSMLNSGAHDDAFYEDLWQTILDGEVWHREEMIDQHKDGSEFYVDQTIAPIVDDDGEIEHFVAVSRDVTELKEYRGLLEERNDQLELLNQIVRHDIRNDMQIVLGMGQSLEAHVGPDGEEYLRPLIEHSEHVVQLTRTVRDLMEVMLSEGAPDLTHVPLSHVLERQIDEVDRGYERATFRVADDLPSVRVAADEMLDSVFRNVLANAVQHNDSDAPVVRISVTERADDVRVSIADNGPGIPDEQKATVFGKGETGLGSDGTGLGLYLVNTIVQQYGGEIRIEDNDPEGSVFHVDLPKASERPRSRGGPLVDE
jgi:PAS domain S-box-containing protein